MTGNRSDALNEGLPACPFCGGSASRPKPTEPHGGMVYCDSCGAGAFGPKWNTRAIPAGFVSVELLNIERAVSDDLRKQNAVLRAVPSPDTVGVREALEAVRGDVVTAIAFLNRDAGTDRIHPTARSIANQLAEADKRILTALALPPSHCTAGRREEIKKTLRNYFDAPHYLLELAAIALTSEQSGPTAGREIGYDHEVTGHMFECPGCGIDCGNGIPHKAGCPRAIDSALTPSPSAEPVAWRWRSKGDYLWIYNPEARWLVQHREDSSIEIEPLYASPPDRQQDQDETSVRGASAEPVAWQPIETAPHETRVLLGWFQQETWFSETGMASHGWRRNGISNMSRHGFASHWQPLPAPPSFDKTGDDK